MTAYVPGLLGVNRRAVRIPSLARSLREVMPDVSQIDRLAGIQVEVPGDPAYAVEVGPPEGPAIPAPPGGTPFDSGAAVLEPVEHVVLAAGSRGIHVT